MVSQIKLTELQKELLRATIRKYEKRIKRYDKFNEETRTSITKTALYFFALEAIDLTNSE